MAINIDELPDAEPSPRPNTSPKAINIADLADETPKPEPTPSPVAQGAPAPRGPINIDELEDSNPIAPLKEVLALGASPVGKALDTLAIPLRAGAGLATKALDKTVLPGIQKRLNAKDAKAPDITFLDVADYASDQAVGGRDRFLKMLIDSGFSAKQASGIYAGYKAAADVGGITANFFLDPLRFVSFGQLTKASEQARKLGLFDEAGNFVKTERNLVDVRVPFTQTKVGVPAAPAAKAAKAVGKAASKVPGAETVSSVGKRFVDSFDYRTGVAEIDQAAAVLPFRKNQDFFDTRKNFLEPLQKNPLEADEKRLLIRLLEGTPNLQPEIPVKGQKLGTSLEAIQASMRTKIPEVQRGLKINPHRHDAIIDQAMEIRKAQAKATEIEWAAGILDESNILNRTVENYFTHLPTPKGRALVRAQRIEDAELALRAQEEALKGELQSGIKSGFLSRFAAGRQKRIVEGQFEQAQEAMSKKYGVQFYVDDPVVATAYRLDQAKKLYRDKEFLDLLEKHGRKARSPEEFQALKKQGWSIIDHPEFSRQGRWKDTLFPPNIADKINYFIKPRELGDFTRFVDSYNKVFKSLALATPGYWVQNWFDDLFKFYIEGGKVSSFVKAQSALMGAKGSTKIAGKAMSYDEVRKLAAGVADASQFSEDMLHQVLYAGKKSWKEQAISRLNPINTAKDMLKYFNQVGERNQNVVRAAFLIDLLERGHTLESAALRTERVLFNFRRTTPGIDFARRFWNPFIQAAIKTAQVTPELLAKNPSAYNQLSNNFMAALARSFHDPVTQQQVLAIVPEYRRFRDPIVGPLLPGNEAVLGAFGGEEQKPLGRVALLTAGIGPDILNRFAIWDSNVARSGFGFGPAMSSLLSVATGKDQFSGAPIDADPNNPDFARRVGYALGNSAWSLAFATPQVGNLVKQRLGMGDVQYYEPETLRLLQASFGQFVQFSNLDKELHFKMLIYQSAERELAKQMSRALMREVQGRDFSQLLSSKPKSIQEVYRFFSLPGSAEILEKRGERGVNTKRAMLSASALRGEMSVLELIESMKELRQQVKDLNANYQTLMQMKLQDLKAWKDANRNADAFKLESEAEQMMKNFLGQASPENL